MTHIELQMQKVVIVKRRAEVGVTYHSPKERLVGHHHVFNVFQVVLHEAILGRARQIPSEISRYNEPLARGVNINAIATIFVQRGQAVDAMQRIVALNEVIPNRRTGIVWPQYDVQEVGIERVRR